MDLMLPDSGLLFWMTIIFVIVFLILAKFGFPVITGMVEKRTKRIDDALAAARKAEEAIADLNQEKDRILDQTRKEQAELLKEAAMERDRIVADAQEMARQQADRILADAKERIAVEKEAALREIRSEVAAVSVAVAQKVLGRELSDKDADRRYIESLMEEEL